MPDEDIYHAAQVLLRRVTEEDNVRLTIGAARNGAPIEIGVLNPGTDAAVIIHAMPLRPGWEWMLTGKKPNQRRR